MTWFRYARMWWRLHRNDYCVKHLIKKVRVGEYLSHLECTQCEQEKKAREDERAIYETINKNVYLNEAIEAVKRHREMNG